MPTTLPANQWQSKRNSRSTVWRETSQTYKKHLLTTHHKRSNQSAKHQEGVTSFDCTATRSSVDQALHRSAKAMPLSACSLPGTQRHLLTQQPAAQTQPMAPSLPALPSTVASPVASQQAHQAPSHFTPQWPCNKSSNATDALVIKAFLLQPLSLLYNYPDFNKYLYIGWYCTCYSMTTLQYPTY